MRVYSASNWRTLRIFESVRGLCETPARLLAGLEQASSAASHLETVLWEIRALLLDKVEISFNT